MLLLFSKKKIVTRRAATKKHSSDNLKTMLPKTQEIHLKVLRHIEDNPEATQRELAVQHLQ